MRKTAVLIVAVGLLLGACRTIIIPKMVTVGASASSGYGNSSNLAQALELQAGASFRVVSHADGMMFADPVGRGKDAIRRANGENPTAVFAIDFPFWFVYKPSQDQDALFQEGLELLKRIKGRLVVGDVPYIKSLDAPFKMHFPSESKLKEYNALLYDMVNESNGRIRLIPMASIVAAYQAGESVTIGNESYDLSGMMARDGLHPNEKGLEFLAERSWALAKD